MTFIEKIKKWFKNEKEEMTLDFISISSMEAKYDEEDYMGAAKDLLDLLETYGRRKKKNHRYKGREFTYFILSNKRKELKNVGYGHWKNLNQFIKLNQTKVYPYHKNNLKSAIDFFKKEIKGLKEIKIEVQ